MERCPSDPPPFGQGGIAIHFLADARKSRSRNSFQTQGSTSFRMKNQVTFSHFSFSSCFARAICCRPLRGLCFGNINNACVPLALTVLGGRHELFPLTPPTLLSTAIRVRLKAPAGRQHKAQGVSPVYKAADVRTNLLMGRHFVLFTTIGAWLNG